MMMSMFYLCITIFSLCAMWIIWVFGFRRLFLAGFRARLFELRNHLFALGESGKIAFDDETYRTLELLLNGLIRYAHRLSFPGYVMSAWHDGRSKREKDYVDFGQSVALRISRLEREVGGEIMALYRKINLAISLYLFATSILFKLLVLGVFITQRFRVHETRKQINQQVYVFEREAYMSAKQRWATA